MNNKDFDGSRGRGRGVQNAFNQPKEVRRPRAAEEVPPPEAPKSNLSADAKEWYPRNYVPQQLAPIYQEPVYTYRPRVSNSMQPVRQMPYQDPFIFDEMATIASYIMPEPEGHDLRMSIANLITVMCEITVCPGKFDNLCGPLVDSFAPCLGDLTYTRALVEAIINQSICESNFRYNGARLCSMYDSVAPPEESTFRSCLLEQCSMQENKIITGQETSEENQRGFALFLAEIYTQLEDNQGRRIRSLGESLCKILLFLLDTQSTVNVKAVCQLLKLSGIALDADCPGGMHIAFDRLEQHKGLPIVRHIVALRASRWGLAEQTLPHPQRRKPNYMGGEVAAGGEGYLVDGHTLTAEERAFLQNNLPSNASLENDIMEELENDSWDTGMDAEMRAGFLEFLKLSNQIKRS